MLDRPPPVRYRRVPVGRRSAAFAIDFVVVALVSSVVGLSPWAQATLFLVGWLAMRVVLVYRNKGQSLGRWALDMRVIDPALGHTPGLQRLGKREAILGVGAALFLLGLVNLSPAAAWSLLLFIPLLVDCGFVFLDPAQPLALHDRLADTLVVETRRGYSLDLKLKRLLVEARRRVK